AQAVHLHAERIERPQRMGTAEIAILSHAAKLSARIRRVKLALIVTVESMAPAARPPQRLLRAANFCPSGGHSMLAARSSQYNGYTNVATTCPAHGLHRRNDGNAAVHRPPRSLLDGHQRHCRDGD